MKEKELTEVIQGNFEVITGVFNPKTKEWIMLSASDVGTREEKKHEILQVEGKKFCNVYELLGFIPADGKVTWISLGESSRERIIESLCKDIKSLVETGKTTWDLRVEKKEEKKEVRSVESMEKKGKQMFCFETEVGAEAAKEVFEDLMAGWEFASAVNWDSNVSGVLRERGKKGGIKTVMGCTDKEIAWLLQQFLDWHFRKNVEFKAIEIKKECIEVEYEMIEPMKLKKPIGRGKIWKKTDGWEAEEK